MEADWEFEVGGDAPIIDAHWSGFVDLRKNPHLASELVEAGQLSGLANVLSILNGANSSAWTSKSDVFDPGEVDADELDATDDHVPHAIACYIDLISGDRGWDSPADAERSCRLWCDRLRKIPLRCCRVDLVIRAALVMRAQATLGATAYFTACGGTEASAIARLTDSLTAFAAALTASE